MKALELQITSVPVETPVKKDAFSVGVAYELSIDGAGKNSFINDIYDAERTSDLIADIQRRVSYGRMTDAERDAIITQSAALIAKASETSSEGIRREYHEICDGAGKRLASLRLESPFFWPKHEEMALGDDYDGMVTGYFNMIKDSDLDCLLFRKCDPALRRDARIIFEPRLRTPWDPPVIIMDIDVITPRIIRDRVNMNRGIYATLKKTFGHYVTDTQAKEIAQMAIAGVNIGDGYDRIFRCYQAVRDGNGVMLGVFMIETPFFSPDPSAPERSPMDYFIRPEADAEDAEAEAV